MVHLQIEIPTWTEFENQLLYSALHLAESGTIKFTYRFNTSLRPATSLLHINGKTCFMDCADQVQFMEDPNRYHCYFKRSLLPEDFRGNVHPLNLMVNFSYKPFKMLAKIGPEGSLHLIRKNKCRK